MDIELTNVEKEIASNRAEVIEGLCGVRDRICSLADRMLKIKFPSKYRSKVVGPPFKTISKIPSITKNVPEALNITAKAEHRQLKGSDIIQLLKDMWNGIEDQFKEFKCNSSEDYDLLLDRLFILEKRLNVVESRVRLVEKRVSLLKDPSC